MDYWKLFGYYKYNNCKLTAHKFQKKHANIDWENQDKDDIYKQYRALGDKVRP